MSCRIFCDEKTYIDIVLVKYAARNQILMLHKICC